MVKFEQILNWLRDGYPQGVPKNDYIALLGVLHHQLTDTEIERVAKALRDEQGREDLTDEKIEQFIRSEVHQRPSAEDVRRVAAHLAEGGWPLAGLGDTVDDQR